MNIAIIPARGGSRRIPRKNIRLFAGKPMIAHSISCALDSTLFGRVVVSTDDEEIASTARAHGAEVPFMRPKDLADDYTGTGAVVAHAVDVLLREGELPAAICCIYPTAPFLHRDDLAAGLALLKRGGWSYVVSAATTGFPPFRTFEKAENGGLNMFFPEYLHTRSQDLPVALHDAAQFYWGTADAWRSQTPIFGASSSAVIIPRWRVQDIDDEEDWARAERMARCL